MVDGPEEWPLGYSEPCQARHSCTHGHVPATVCPCAPLIASGWVYPGWGSPFLLGALPGSPELSRLPHFILYIHVHEWHSFDEVPSCHAQPGHLNMAAVPGLTSRSCSPGFSKQDKTTLNNRYLFLLNRSRIAEITHFRPAMGLFVLLSLTVLEADTDGLLPPFLLLGWTLPQPQSSWTWCARLPHYAILRSNPF